MSLTSIGPVGIRPGSSWLHPFKNKAVVAQNALPFPGFSLPVSVLFQVFVHYHIQGPYFILYWAGLLSHLSTCLAD